MQVGVKSSSVGYSGIHPTTATQLNGASKAFRRHGATSGPGLRRHCPPQVGDGFWFSTWSLSNRTSEDKRTESEGGVGGGGAGVVVLACGRRAVGGCVGLLPVSRDLY